jgi:branched-chain amino acid transport system ATP-binding protein
MAAPLPQYLLSCRSVSKYFGAMAAVRDLSFDLLRGEILGIGGPNGAGKTTLFDVISGLQPADDGKIVFDGEDVSMASPAELCHRGLARVFQSIAAFDSMTVRENVIVGAAYGHVRWLMPPLRFGRAMLERADAALEQVGLHSRAASPISTLSVLERKLAMIASALATQPNLLLLDEPVGGLNPHEIDRIVELVRTLSRNGMTIILIEHVMRFMVQLCSRVVIMQQGQKIYEGSPQGMLRDSTVVSVYLGDQTAKRLSHLIAAS